jgi:hypothetical protein
VISEADIRAQLQIRIQRDGLLAAAQYLKVCPPYLVRIAQGKDPVSKVLRESRLDQVAPQNQGALAL